MPPFCAAVRCGRARRARARAQAACGLPTFAIDTPGAERDLIVDAERARAEMRGAGRRLRIVMDSDAAEVGVEARFEKAALGGG
jgi:hypothetical protein